MTNNKNAGYKVNFTTKTLTITKAFEEDLMNGDANAMAVVTRFQSMFPDLTIVRKTHRSPKATNPDKGLTYERMERYISLHENSGELLEMFQKVKAIASTQKNSFLYTKRWIYEASSPTSPNCPPSQTASCMHSPLMLPKLKKRKS